MIRDKAELPEVVVLVEMILGCHVDMETGYWLLLTYKFKCVQLIVDLDLEDIRVEPVSEGAEKLDVLRAAEVERL